MRADSNPQGILELFPRHLMSDEENLLDRLNFPVFFFVHQTSRPGSVLVPASQPGLRDSRSRGRDLKDRQLQQ